MPHFNLKSLTTAIMFTCAAQAAFAGGLTDNKVVMDARGNVITSRVHGTCVRTKWESGNDACNPDAPKAVAKVVPEPVPAPAPAPAPTTVIAKSERTVYFDFDSAKLTDESRQKLNSVADILKDAKDVKSASIIGYADRKGSSSYNVKLSEKRAETVKDYLGQQGYFNTQVAEVRGLGATDSVTSCDSNLARAEEISCLAQDRRVELEVEYLENTNQ